MATHPHLRPPCGTKCQLCGLTQRTWPIFRSHLLAKHSQRRHTRHTQPVGDLEQPIPHPAFVVGRLPCPDALRPEDELLDDDGTVTSPAARAAMLAAATGVNSADASSTHAGDTSSRAGSCSNASLAAQAQQETLAAVGQAPRVPVPVQHLQQHSLCHGSGGISSSSPSSPAASDAGEFFLPRPSVLNVRLCSCLCLTFVVMWNPRNSGLFYRCLACL